MAQVFFGANWKGHGRATPFRANDDFLAIRPTGVILSGGNGVALNLGQKAEEKGIKIARFDLRAAHSGE